MGFKKKKRVQCYHGYLWVTCSYSWVLTPTVRIYILKITTTILIHNPLSHLKREGGWWLLEDETNPPTHV
jgi:hypothetical protein